MNFTRAGQYWEQSECGRYTVSKGFVNGQPQYCAHLVGRPGETLGCFATSDEARQCCRDHAAPIPETDLVVTQAGGEG